MIDNIKTVMLIQQLMQILQDNNISDVDKGLMLRRIGKKFSLLGTELMGLSVLK